MSRYGTTFPGMKNWSAEAAQWRMTDWPDQQYWYERQQEANGLAQSSEGPAVRAEDQDTMLRLGSFVHYKSRREGLQSMVLPVRSTDTDAVRAAWDADAIRACFDQSSTDFSDVVARSINALGQHTDAFIARYGMAPVWRAEFGPFEEIRDHGKPIPVSYSITYTVDVGETLRRAAQVAVEGHKAEVHLTYREPA